MMGRCSLQHTVNTSRGFTLVEIMVAVAILGLVGVTLVTNANRSTRDIVQMRDKIEALSIAEYALNSALIRDDAPDIGRDEELIDRADRRWLVELEVSETLNERVLRLDVLVRPYERSESGQDRATVLLSGFKTDINP